MAGGNYLCCCSVSLWTLATVLAMPQPAAADDAAEIRARIMQWTDDFNAGHKDAACDLFSKELISDFRGEAEANYATRCALIVKAIDDPARKFQYRLHIKEIMTGGDLVVVRLDWTLEVSPPDQKEVETGMDIFRKENNGAWRVIRYMAYEAPR